MLYKYFLPDLSYVTILPPTKEEVYDFARMPALICLSVCLCARLLKKMMDEMLGVDRCRDMDKLINF